MKNLEILISESFFLGLVSLRKARQSISCSINLFLMIIDAKVVLKKLLNPADLPKTQSLCIHELTEIVMVSKDKNLVFVVF